jgi:DNA-binding CsgD family transcriptional regulator
MHPGSAEPMLVDERAVDRVSSRLLIFVFDLLRQQGVDPVALASDLPSFAGHAEVPAWVTWSDYITMIQRLGDVAGGPTGIATGMRATLSTAYSELRALAGFFSGPIPYFSFVTHHLMRELVPGVEGRVAVLSDRNIRVRYRIADSLVASMLYFHGTVTLLEVFPTHFGLAEARVTIVSMTDRTCELLAEFPNAKAKVTWGAHLSTQPAAPATSLTPREQEVLRFVCQGLTNAEIATALGTASSTVKSQISSILMKMDVANRTELAARVARGR